MRCLQRTLPEPVYRERPIELVRLYVSRDSWGARCSALMQPALMRRSAETSTLWLGVWERNHRAQAFYRKWNFAKWERTRSIRRRSQTDLLMQRSISNEA